MHQRHPHDPVQRLNEHHAEDLLAVARAFGGHPDATAALATNVGSAGLDLDVATPAGAAMVHVDFRTTVGELTGAMSRAFRDLARHAHDTLIDTDAEAP